MQSIQAFLSSIVVGPAVASADLSIFPLLRTLPAEPAYDTLQNAIRAGQAKVTEVSESGHVPELRVVNDGGSSVLIVDGEELVGAKQNRIVNITILVPPQSTLTIPVSCVEAGRWSAQSREFAPAERAYHASGRLFRHRQGRRSGGPAREGGAGLGIDADVLVTPFRPGGDLGGD